MITAAAELAVWAVAGFTALPTIFFNLYMILMSLRSHRQHGHWMPCETIILALSVYSGAFQICSYCWLTVEEMDRGCLLNVNLFIGLMVIIFGLKFTVIWTTAFLTFFYSTKLVIEPIHCYTKIQDAFLKHVGTVVIAIPLCGFASCVPVVMVLATENGTLGNDCCTPVISSGHSGSIYAVSYVLISDIIPGLLMLKSSISITVHLAIHLHHMKVSNNGFHAPKLGAEMRVIRMNLGLVLAFLCFLCVDIYSHYVSIVKMQNVMMLSVLFFSIYTGICSLMLIYGKKTFWKELLHLHNLFLDEFPCLGCLKVPEGKSKQTAAPGH